MSGNSITITGNLGDDPELRFTPNGSPVVKFSVGVTEKYRDNNNKWQERETSWFTVTAWRDLAENVSESLTRGSRVTVIGSHRSRKWEDREGNKRVSWEVQAEEIAASLKYASVKIHKAARGPVSEDPWADANSSAESPVNETTGEVTTPVKANASDRGGRK